MYNTSLMYNKLRYLTHNRSKFLYIKYSLKNFSTDNTIHNQKRKRFKKLWFCGIALAGVAFGAIYSENIIRNILSEKATVVWDPDWDKNWRPFETNNDEFTKIRTRRHILLIRHGQYSNIQSRDDDIQGLTDMGKEQANILGQRLQQILKGKKIRAIYHSDMKRAKETAEIMAQHLKNIKVYEDSNLAEGVPEFPDPPSASFIPNEYEVEIGKARIEKAFQTYFFRPPTAKIPPQSENDYDVYDIIVCHANVIRYMFCRALQFPPSACTTWLTIDNRGHVSATEFGNTGFLSPDKITYH